MLYCCYMRQDQSFWSEWQKILHNSGLNDLAIVLFEGAAPLRIVFAQAVYACSALLGDPDQWQALARTLENGADSRLFAEFLREEQHS